MNNTVYEGTYDQCVSWINLRKSPNDYYILAKSGKYYVCKLG